MSVKEIDNIKATSANAIRGIEYTVYTIQIHTNKYLEHDPSKPTTTSMKER